MFEVGGWRLEVRGWRFEVGGSRFEVGGSRFRFNGRFFSDFEPIYFEGLKSFQMPFSGFLL